MPSPGAGLSIRVLPGRYAVCRLPAESPAAVLAAAAHDEKAFFSLTRTADEISIVCDEARAPAAARIEGGWRLLMIEGPLDFSLVGILASLTGTLAQAGIPVFAVSTFDTDYLLVKEDRWPQARRALTGAGYRLTAEEDAPPAE